MNVEELLKKMEEKLKEMELIFAEINKDPAEAEAKNLKNAYDIKNKEYEECKSRYETAKKLNDTLVSIENERKNIEVKTRINVNPQNEEVKSKTITISTLGNEVKEERELCLGFIKSLSTPGISASEVSDVILDKLKSKGTRNSGLDLEMPKIYQKAMTMRNKDYTPSLSTDATGYATDSGMIRTIDPNFIPNLLKMDVYEPSLFDLTTPVNIYNGRAQMPKLDQETAGDFGGVQSYWDTEGDDLTETRIHFKTESVSTNRLQCISLVSNESLRRSAIDIEAELMTQFRNAARREMSKAILFGIGTTQPLGIILTPGIHAINRQGANAVEYTDLVNLQQSCRYAVRNGARFVVADSAATYMQSLVDNYGQPLFSENVSSGMRQGLIGVPSLVHEYKNASPTTYGDLGKKGDIVYGNFKYYMFGIEENIRIARTTERYFEKDVTAFKMVSDVAGKCIFPSSFAVLSINES